MVNLKIQKGDYFCMPAQWTAEIIGKMHLHGITAVQLAAEINWHPKYLSAVLNGRKTPLEAENKVRIAVDHLISNSQDGRR